MKLKRRMLSLPVANGVDGGGGKSPICFTLQTDDLLQLDKSKSIIECHVTFTE